MSKKESYPNPPSYVSPMIQQHFGYLGLKVKDRVTGYSGVITSISFDLYGCVMGCITPIFESSSEKQDLKNGYWFDTKRLQILDDTPVMETPFFEAVPGGMEHPEFTSQPSK